MSDFAQTFTEVKSSLVLIDEWIDEASEIEQVASCLLELTSLKADIDAAKRKIEDRLGALMDDKEVTVEGVGAFRRSARGSKTNWQKEDLMRAVLDSRIEATAEVLDEETGELKIVTSIVDETPLDKVLHVWNHGAPRTTALKERGLEANEFCDVAYEPGYSIRVL